MNDSNKKIAVIGEKDIILPFKAVGFDVYFDTEKADIIVRCKDLFAKDYKIILITEREAEKVTEYLDTMADVPYPIIIPIPDGITNNGYGIKRLNKNIEKAIGSEAGEGGKL
jgi:V/A-type H+-transporting ATPase subunit F